jgi:2-oxoisovalerate dehydrogenase E1 component beta subunit
MRYRSGNEWNCGGLVIRTPCSAVGHGGHYHSQSPEAFFSHVPGLKVVMPRGCVQAKGLLTSSVLTEDPVLFLEPKSLYRTLEEDVPKALYSLDLETSEVISSGDDLTIVSFGPQLYVVEKAIEELKKTRNRVSIEVIDLQTLYPFDEDTVYESVKKTGRVIVTHEAPLTGGIGAEIAAKIQKNCFLHLEAPVERVCGMDTPFPLTLEPVYLPNIPKLLQAMIQTLDY